jgi:hypothetical protein
VASFFFFSALRKFYSLYPFLQLTPEEFRKGTKRIPPGVYAHDAMERNGQTLEPQDLSAGGLLGRLIDTLDNSATPFKSLLFSLNGQAKMVLGGTSAPEYLSPAGVVRMRNFDTMTNIVGCAT